MYTSNLEKNGYYLPLKRGRLNTLEFLWMKVDHWFLRIHQCIFTMSRLFPPLKKDWLFINDLFPSMTCLCDVEENTHGSSGEEYFEKSSMHFHYVVIKSPKKTACTWSLI